VRFAPLKLLFKPCTTLVVWAVKRMVETCYEVVGVNADVLPKQNVPSKLFGFAVNSTV
jgi:hypothetical protein